MLIIWPCMKQSARPRYTCSLHGYCSLTDGGSACRQLPSPPSAHGGFTSTVPLGTHAHWKIHNFLHVHKSLVFILLNLLGTMEENDHSPLLRRSYLLASKSPENPVPGFPHLHSRTPPAHTLMLSLRPSAVKSPPPPSLLTLCFLPR